MRELSAFLDPDGTTETTERHLHSQTDTQQSLLTHKQTVCYISISSISAKACNRHAVDQHDGIMFFTTGAHPEPAS